MEKIRKVTAQLKEGSLLIGIVLGKIKVRE